MVSFASHLALIFESLRVSPSKSIPSLYECRQRSAAAGHSSTHALVRVLRVVPLLLVLKLDIFVARDLLLLEVGEFEIFGACSIEKVRHVAESKEIHQLLGLLSSLLLLDLLLGLLFDHLDTHFGNVVNVD